MLPSSTKSLWIAILALSQLPFLAPTTPIADEPNSPDARKLEKPRIVASELVDPNKSIAIGGAWQRVQAALADVVANKPVKARYAIPKPDSQRFLGFLEGLLRVSLPASFSDQIIHADILWNGHIQFPVQKYSPWNRELRDGITPLDIPITISTFEKDRVTVRVSTGAFPTTGEDGAITLPAALSKQIIDDSDQGFLLISSAVFTKGRVFVAVMDTEYPGGQVRCLKGSNGESLWAKQVADYTGKAWPGGIAEWFTEMRVVDEQLILFHCCETSFGIEGLTLDGESLFAFYSMQ